MPINKKLSSWLHFIFQISLTFDGEPWRVSGKIRERVWHVKKGYEPGVNPWSTWYKAQNEVSHQHCPPLTLLYFFSSPLSDLKKKTASGSKMPEFTFSFVCNWNHTRNKIPQKTFYLPKEITPIVISNYANPKSHPNMWPQFFFLNRTFCLNYRDLCTRYLMVFPFLTQRKTLHSHKGLPQGG